jgi:hypothetical protein
MNWMNYITKQDFIANTTTLRGTIRLVILKSYISKILQKYSLNI